MGSLVAQVSMIRKVKKKKFSSQTNCSSKTFLALQKCTFDEVLLFIDVTDVAVIESPSRVLVMGSRSWQV
jgi:hypothetical protein